MTSSTRRARSSAPTSSGKRSSAAYRSARRTVSCGMEDVVLRHEPDALAELVVVGVEVAARVLDAAFVGRPEPRQRLEQRRLSRPARPDHGQQALRLQAEPDAVEELLALRGPHDDALGAETDVAGVDVLDEPAVPLIAALEVQQCVTDPDDVVGPDLLPPDPLPVDERAVGAVQVGKQPTVPVADQLGVLPRGQQVGDDDVVALVPTDREALRGGAQVVDRRELPLLPRPLRRGRRTPLLGDHRWGRRRAQHRRGAGEEFDDGGGGVLPEPDGDGSADRFAGQAAVADERPVAALVEDLPPERPDPYDEVAARDLRPEDLEVARLVAADDELPAGPRNAPVSAHPDLEHARGRRRPALAGLIDLRHEPPWESGSRGPGIRAASQPTGVVSGLTAVRVRRRVRRGARSRRTAGAGRGPTAVAVPVPPPFGAGLRSSVLACRTALTAGGGAAAGATAAAIDFAGLGVPPTGGAACVPAAGAGIAGLAEPSASVLSARVGERRIRCRSCRNRSWVPGGGGSCGLVGSARASSGPVDLGAVAARDRRVLRQRGRTASRRTVRPSSSPRSPSSPDPWPPRRRSRRRQSQSRSSSGGVASVVGADLGVSPRDSPRPRRRRRRPRSRSAAPRSRWRSRCSTPTTT